MSNQKKNHSADLADALRSASAEFAQEKEKETVFREKAKQLTHQSKHNTFYAIVKYEKKVLYYRNNLLAGDRLYDESAKKVLVVTNVHLDRINLNLSGSGGQFEYACNVADFMYADEMPDAARNANLERLKTQIEEAKDSLIIKRKDKALKMYKDFKLCITNNERDFELFESFVKILTPLSSSAAATAKLIIEDNSK